MTSSFSISDTAFASLDMQGADTQALSPIYFLQRAAHVDQVRDEARDSENHDQPNQRPSPERLKEAGRV